MLFHQAVRVLAHVVTCMIWRVIGSEFKDSGMEFKVSGQVPDEE